MGFPNVSSATSGQPGALWARVTPAGGGPPNIIATQWDTLVRRFQSKAINLINGPVYTFDENNVCNTRSVAPTGTVRRRSDITADGLWGAETAAALGAILCQLGQQQRAEQLAREIKSRSVLSLDTLDTLLWITFFVTGISDGVASAPIPVTAVQVPDDTILPNWRTRVVSDPLDSNWVGVFPESGTPERSPSEQRQATGGGAPQVQGDPVPTTPSTSTSTTPGASGTGAGGASTTTTGGGAGAGAGGAGGAGGSTTLTTTSGAAAPAPVAKTTAWYSSTPVLVGGALALVAVVGIAAMAMSSRSAKGTVVNRRQMKARTARRPGQGYRQVAAPPRSRPQLASGRPAARQLASGRPAARQLGKGR